MKTTTSKGQEETFESDGYDYYLDCGDDFIGVCMCPKSSDCVIKLNMTRFFVHYLYLKKTKIKIKYCLIATPDG